jgi:FlaA1/EpsC-like NDP-sugar epimerase
MNKPTIIITGANGFIGQQLLQHFLNKNWNVKAFVRSVPKNKFEGVEYIIYNLEEKPNEALLNPLIIWFIVLIYDSKKIRMPILLIWQEQKPWSICVEKKS